MKIESLPGFKRQQGAVLAIALVFMLLLTIIGAGAMQSSSLQERMAGNSRDLNSSFQAAEAAVRAAESYLQGATVGPFAGSSGRYRYCGNGVTGSDCNGPDWFTRSSTGWIKRTGTLAGLNEQPEYTIQQLPPIPDPESSLAADEATPTMDVYIVTARGFGSSSNTMAVIQTIYRRS